MRAGRQAGMHIAVRAPHPAVCCALQLLADQIENVSH
jgi:hypothetical protein